MSAPPFFIVGSGRCGSTMLRAMINRNPQVAVPFESQFIVSTIRDWGALAPGGNFRTEDWLKRWGKRLDLMGLSRDEVARRLEELPRPTSPRAMVDAVFQLALETEGKERWGDKTPGYATSVALLERTFPGAQFIHLVRDGRDVAVSFLNQPFGPSTVSMAAIHWKQNVEAARRDGLRIGPERYKEVFYEDLIKDPSRQLEELCGFLGIDFGHEMLAFHEDPGQGMPRFNDDRHKGLEKPVQSGMRDWRSEMPESDQRVFEAIAGRTLSDMGYERRFPRASVADRLRVARTHLSWQLKRMRTLAKPSKIKSRLAGRFRSS